jgi:hypothetical protein
MTLNRVGYGLAVVLAMMIAPAVLAVVTPIYLPHLLASPFQAGVRPGIVRSLSVFRPAFVLVGLSVGVAMDVNAWRHS